MVQDLAFQLDDRRRRVEAELLEQHPTNGGDPVEGVGLAACCVQQPRQALPQRLAVGMLGDEGLDQRHELRRPPGVDAGGHRDWDQLEAPPIEAHDLCVDVRRRTRRAERRAAPQLECGPCEAECIAVVARLMRRSSVAGEAFEPVDVDRVLRQVEHVAGRMSHHCVAQSDVAERSPDLGDVYLETRSHRGWRALAPERIDELLR